MLVDRADIRFYQCAQKIRRRLVDQRQNKCFFREQHLVSFGRNRAEKSHSGIFQDSCAVQIVKLFVFEHLALEAIAGVRGEEFVLQTGIILKNFVINIVA